MVDMAKIVYYPQFWDLAHRFYEESWEYSCGVHYNEILIEYNIGFPLVHSEANFHHPKSKFPSRAGEDARREGVRAARGAPGDRAGGAVFGDLDRLGVDGGTQRQLHRASDSAVSLTASVK